MRNVTSASGTLAATTGKTGDTALYLNSIHGDVALLLPLDTLEKREAVAVDGKTARGSRTRDRRAVHLLAACLHGTRTVIAQRQVDSKSNEISAFRPLLGPVVLTGKVVTFDALLTQHDHARFLVEEKNAYYIDLIKGNHPTLHAQLKQLPGPRSR